MTNINSIIRNSLQRLEKIDSPSQKGNVVARLRNLYQDNQEKISSARMRRDDAVQVRLSKRRFRTAQPVAQEALALGRKMAAATPDETQKLREPVFYPGKTISGVYKGDQFRTEEGHKGKSYHLPGGQYAFEVGGFKGILMKNNTAAAYNPKTGESYFMDVRISDGKFEISNIRNFPRKTYDTADKEPIVSEAETKGVSFKYTPNGLMSAHFVDEETGRTVNGAGFLNKDGQYILAADNGVTYGGHYGFDENGKLLIYDKYILDS